MKTDDETAIDESICPSERPRKRARRPAADEPAVRLQVMAALADTRSFYDSMSLSVKQLTLLPSQRQRTSFLRVEVVIEPTRSTAFARRTAGKMCTVLSAWTSAQERTRATVLSPSSLLPQCDSSRIWPSSAGCTHLTHLSSEFAASRSCISYGLIFKRG